MSWDSLNYLFEETNSENGTTRSNYKSNLMDDTKSVADMTYGNALIKKQKRNLTYPRNK